MRRSASPAWLHRRSRRVGGEPSALTLLVLMLTAAVSGNGIASADDPLDPDLSAIVEDIETSFEAIRTARGSFVKTEARLDSPASSRDGGDGSAQAARSTIVSSGQFSYAAPNTRVSITEPDQCSAKEQLFTPEMTAIQTDAPCGQSGDTSKASFLLVRPDQASGPPIQFLFPWEFEGEPLGEFLRAHVGDLRWRGQEERGGRLLDVLQIDRPPRPGETWVRLYIERSTGLKLLEKHCRSSDLLSVAAEVQNIGGVPFTRKITESLFHFASADPHFQTVVELDEVEVNGPIPGDRFTLAGLIGARKVTIDDQRAVRKYTWDGSAGRDPFELEAMIAAGTETPHEPPSEARDLSQTARDRGPEYPPWYGIAVVVAVSVLVANLGVIPWSLSRLLKRRAGT